MSKALKIYNSNSVSCVACAIPIEEGKADPFVSVEYDEDDFTTEVGVDGQVTRIAVNNPVVKVSLTLQATSRHNAELSALRAIAKTADGGADVGVFYLKDNNGTTMHQAVHCWISKPPTTEFGKSPGTRVWTFTCVMNPGQVW
jgi:hypothetical protein